MTVLARSRRMDDDDEDVFDSDLYDPKYYPRKVFRDGKGLRVPVLLTDAMPPAYRAAISRGRTVFDARNHRPHFAVIRDDAAHRRAVDAYEDRNKWLQDAWKNPRAQTRGQMQQSPDNGDPDGDDDDGDLSPRDAYIQRLQGAYRTPVGNGYGNGADAIEAQRRSWTRESAGGGRAPSSVTFGQHNARGHVHAYAAHHARPREQFSACARPRSLHRDFEGRERDPEAPAGRRRDVGGAGGDHKTARHAGGQSAPCAGGKPSQARVAAAGGLKWRPSAPHRGISRRGSISICSTTGSR